MSQEWVAASYPLDILEDQRLKTLFCLLFDRVVLHFPIAHTGCGGGWGITGEFEDPLIHEGVIDLREEFFLDEIIATEYPSSYVGLEDEEFERYFDLNVAGMALKCCSEEGAVPATWKIETPVPLYMLAKFNVNSCADLQASALAIQSLDLTLPSFSTLNSYDILEARELLKDQLGPFRTAMYSLAPSIRSAISSGASLDDVCAEAKYLAQTTIIPQLEDLNRKLKLERGAFWRKLILKVAGRLPSIAFKWMSCTEQEALLDVAKLAQGVGMQALESDSFRKQLLLNEGLGFLIAAQDTVEDLL
ncbi:hypothetical protein [Desulfovibrio ferrophilus]|uniref:Phosphoglycerate mutase family protein n=1 Tax=Desulfovibrio ferrophilus TaxID=241368 RepID=A0A2Z6B2L0_9BACT|nr:hypothetical protein [Desulfovibrio ferrophilus]BBD09764.1 phosphoglycerate mutase family protein [Desulfovibrio ferrophilus]